MNETLSEYYKNIFDHLLYLLPFRNAVILLRGNPAMQTSTFPTMCFSFLFCSGRQSKHKYRLRVLTGMLLENNKKIKF